MDSWLSSRAPRGCDVRRGWEVRAAGLFWGVGGIWGMGGTAVAIQGAVGGARHTGSVNERKNGRQDKEGESHEGN